MVYFKYVFEFDPLKSIRNRIKHGIDFFEAQKLWDSPVLRVPVRHSVEDRELAIGEISGRVWTAIVTFREGKIRIISMRRAREKEERLYRTYYR